MRPRSAGEDIRKHRDKVLEDGLFSPMPHGGGCPPGGFPQTRPASSPLAVGACMRWAPPSLRVAAYKPAKILSCIIALLMSNQCDTAATLSVAVFTSPSPFFRCKAWCAAYTSAAAALCGHKQGRYQYTLTAMAPSIPTQTMP